ncbi:MAG: bifunctional phosphopantothenoylcysteine decarboxylase/phosphopantothenate--cysteine ligase CoaBC [Chloroflexi bacterium]|nr:bifunctional phosphopantothenoylcysteine decarboxylase/phosphopantothenate--cysteine ligase CoaBC [Chloroflexota bacterium]
MSVLAGKRVLLGVTGSIASYKAVELASTLTQLGLEVDVVLTRGARQFVSALTFQSVTGQRAYVDEDLWGAEGHVLHIGLGKAAELIVVAPATANTLAKLASGTADNLLTLTALASEAPLLVAPAMDGGMFEHPATQVNLALLKERGVEIVGPESGHLASGLEAIGRMTEPARLAGHVRKLLGRSGPLVGQTVVVSAGGTQEAIDPVRVIANRSSGKQGYALAQAAIDLGAEVVLVSGPTALVSSVGAQLVSVTSGREMKAEVVKAARKADALLMAAAVADFRPTRAAKEKIKRVEGAPKVALTANPDILEAVSEGRKKFGKPRVVVGFAAESENLLENAAGKLRAKDVDLMVANDISAAAAGFEVDTNQVVLVDAGGHEELPLMSKAEVGERVLARVVEMLEKLK